MKASEMDAEEIQARRRSGKNSLPSDHRYIGRISAKQMTRGMRRSNPEQGFSKKRTGLMCAV